MAKKFLGENFLLNSETAEKLYHQYAKELPIIDYHCHLSPQEIYENKTFRNLTEAWLDGDHYKWRVMRACGIDEELITGGADDYDKFLAWAKVVPQLLGNPLYHWTHLELQRFFGIDKLLNEETAPVIWEQANAQLQSEGFGARDLITKSKVTVVCTTDDPADSLEYHLKIKELEGFDTLVLPSFRPDKFLEINRATFKPWLAKLEAAAGKPIQNYGALLDALRERIDFFHEIGGRVSDHALDTLEYEKATLEEVEAIFAKALSQGSVTPEEERKYKSYTMVFLGKEYAARGWAMQLHIHALRNTNTAMFQRLGPDTGYDAINDGPLAEALARLLDAIEQDGGLPKTILYSLNPNDYWALASIMGSFQGGGVPGKIQFGTAWWFNDNKDGMIQQMHTLANFGVLSQFIGMLTDSRSFLSYTRHEYFRRLLCDVLGDWVERGEAPEDYALLGRIVTDICYGNAKRYFAFPEA
ncbi:glucuronate isomerase [Paenibacillus sp. p3-SID1389]|uniref:glucuronate isomerase n=1 Tax=Paenibacillus sp. p3-SID1389 TaxID=2916364 RepID=UPI0021A2C5F0|nr:glucuronate isomerase [Paenibacillus sp. p3-SID1389]MCT2197404.1 glucuronate isomerase [Paenibacillus sp. p3-SID1389]